MIGNVIQSQYLVVRDYPTAAALSFMLMIGVLIIIGDRRARCSGLRRLSEAAGGMRTHRRPHPRLGDRRLGGPGDPLPVRPDLRDRPVLVQRQQGPLQLHLAGLHAQALADPFGVDGPAAAFTNSLSIAALTTLIAVDARHVDRAGARPLPLPGPRRRRTAWCSCRWRRPRSCSARRCSAVPDARRSRAGFTTILIAHVMFTLGYVVVTVRARLEGMDLHIEEAAQDLGANQFTTFRKITLPLIARASRPPALLAFAISIDDFVVTNFNAGQTMTFPLFIFGASRQGVPPQVNVLATMLLIGVMALMVLNVLWQRRAAKRDGRMAPEIELPAR